MSLHYSIVCKLLHSGNYELPSRLLYPRGGIMVSHLHYPTNSQPKWGGRYRLWVSVDQKRHAVTIAQMVFVLTHRRAPKPDHRLEHIDGDVGNLVPENLVEVAKQAPPPIPSVGESGISSYPQNKMNPYRVSGAVFGSLVTYGYMPTLEYARWFRDYVEQGGGAAYDDSPLSAYYKRIGDECLLRGQKILNQTQVGENNGPVEDTE